jgi:hypothetical protein
MSTPIPPDPILRHAHMARDDRLDQALLYREGISHRVAAPRTRLQSYVLDRIDPKGSGAVVSLVALHRSPLLGFLLGSLRGIGLDPIGGGRGASFEGVDPLPEVEHLIAQELVLLLAPTVLRLVFPPLLGGESDRPNLATLAHIIDGSASRI